MLSDMMKYYEIKQDFRNAGFFETEHHKKIIAELKIAIKSGKLIALTGIVGCGKTTLLRHAQQFLRKEKEIIISKSLCVEKDRVKLGTLIAALFYDLSTDKEVKIPSHPEKRERQLQDLCSEHKKPIALFIDEAHDLHGKTLLGLKRLFEIVTDGGGTLSVVLVGHPRLKNDLRRPTMEEIGSRSTVLMLEGIKNEQHSYIKWLLSQCIKTNIKPNDVLTEDAIELLSTKLTTPLQIEHYLSLAIEEGYKVGQKPIPAAIIENVLSKNLDSLEPRLTRYGYNVKTLSSILDVPSTEIRAFFRGQIPPERAKNLKDGMLALGLPL